MPVSLTVRATGFDLLKRQLTALQKQEVPFAAARAATDVAFMARKEAQAEMRRVFDRPTPWTLGGMVVDKADHKTGKPARVRFEEFSDKGTPSGSYLRPQMEGGPRGPTPFERRLHTTGHLQPGEFLVPARYAERDGAGNLLPGQVTKILSDLGTIREAMKGPAPRDRGERRDERYRIEKPGPRAPRGIYLHKGGHKLLVFVIVRQPRYRKIFDFNGVVRRTVEREFAAAFRKNLARAVSTSRNNPANSAQAA